MTSASLITKLPVILAAVALLALTTAGCASNVPTVTIPTPSPGAPKPMVHQGRTMATPSQPAQPHGM